MFIKVWETFVKAILRYKNNDFPDNSTRNHRKR